MYKIRSDQIRLDYHVAGIEAKAFCVALSAALMSLRTQVFQITRALKLVLRVMLQEKTYQIVCAIGDM